MCRNFIESRPKKVLNNFNFLNINIIKENSKKLSLSFEKKILKLRNRMYFFHYQLGNSEPALY